MLKTKNKKQVYLSIIIPAYNEERKIKNDIVKGFAFFQKEKINGEIIVSTDGVTDKTNQIVKNLQKKYKNLTLLSKKHKIGKGMAIKRGVKKAKGKYIMFADAGYCVPFRFIKAGIKTIQNGNDCALASRACKTSQIKQKQPFYRQLGSKMFGFIVRNLLGTPNHIKDTQCGFKIYKQNAANQIFKQLKTDSFMFDIELILLSKKLNHKIASFPVSWSNDSDTKFNPVGGSLKNIKDLLTIKFIYRL